MCVVLLIDLGSTHVSCTCTASLPHVCVCVCVCVCMRAHPHRCVISSNYLSSVQSVSADTHTLCDVYVCMLHLSPPIRLFIFCMRACSTSLHLRIHLRMQFTFCARIHHNVHVCVFLFSFYPSYPSFTLLICLHPFGCAPLKSFVPHLPVNYIWTHACVLLLAHKMCLFSVLCPHTHLPVCVCSTHTLLQ